MNKKLLIGLVILGAILFLSTKVGSFVKDVTPPQTCEEAKARYLRNIPSTSDLYNPQLDLDQDGYSCE